MTTEVATDTRALLEEAQTVKADLDNLWASLEASRLSPYAKSTLAGELCESRARVDDVIRRCGQSLATDSSF